MSCSALKWQQRKNTQFPLMFQHEQLVHSNTLKGASTGGRRGEGQECDWWNFHKINENFKSSQLMFLIILIPFVNVWRQDRDLQSLYLRLLKYRLLYKYFHFAFLWEPSTHLACPWGMSPGLASCVSPCLSWSGGQCGYASWCGWFPRLVSSPGMSVPCYAFTFRCVWRACVCVSVRVCRDGTLCF